MEALLEDYNETQKGKALTWQPLRLLTFYRLILASMLLVLYVGLEDNSTLGGTNPALYTLVCIFYIVFSLVAGFTARLRRPDFDTQTIFQILVDIVTITLLAN